MFSYVTVFGLVDKINLFFLPITLNEEANPMLHLWVTCASFNSISVVGVRRLFKCIWDN